MAIGWIDRLDCRHLILAATNGAWPRRLFGNCPKQRAEPSAACAATSRAARTANGPSTSGRTDESSDESTGWAGACGAACASSGGDAVTGPASAACCAACAQRRRAGTADRTFAERTIASVGAAACPNVRGAFTASPSASDAACDAPDRAPSQSRTCTDASTRICARASTCRDRGGSGLDEFGRICQRGVHRAPPDR